MDQADLIISYDSIGFKEGTIEVGDFANSLLALDNFIKQTNLRVNGSKNISLTVLETRKGSFEILLGFVFLRLAEVLIAEFGRDGYGAVKEFARSTKKKKSEEKEDPEGKKEIEDKEKKAFKKDAKNIKEFLFGKSSKNRSKEKLGYMNYMKKTAEGRAVKIEALPELSNEKKETSGFAVFNDLFESNIALNNYFLKILTSINKENCNSVSFGIPNAHGKLDEFNKIKFDKDDLSYFNAKAEEKTIKKFIDEFYIALLPFHFDNKWKIYNKNRGKISATMLDEEFLNKIKKNKISFKGNSKIDCTVVVKENPNLIKQKKKYYIIKVNKIIKI